MTSEPPLIPTIPIAPENFKSGFVALLGRPNVGKSTLMNQLVGQKIAITSPVAQTTRNRLRGIFTSDKAQIIFVDTPGIHKPHHELGKILVKNARSTVGGVDVVVFIVDGSVPLGKGDLFIADFLKKTQAPVILGVNKIDQRPEHKPHILESYQELAEQNHWLLQEFSALKGDLLPNLETALTDALEPGPYYYPPDLVTDQPERFIIAELIREQILLHTRQEIPHSVAIAIEQMKEGPEITEIRAAINVERSSQKGIVIGKKGSMLKVIGSAARQQIQKLIAGKVYLELFVKVQPKWRQSRANLAEFGYRVEEG